MIKITFSAILIFYSVVTFGQAMSIPATIQVKSGTVILHAYARGVQVYVCTQDAKDTTHYTWVFERPRAILYADSAYTHPIGKHYFDQANSPTWSNRDGSVVTGTKVAEANSKDKLSVPWLLLKASNTQGHGVLTTTTFIQRISTKGGKPVAEADVSQKGKSLDVPYQAEYLFYSDKQPTG
jgi:hypothetical protein